MEPFAYQKPKRPDHRKLLLLALAGASFSIWFFDLVPELAPVSTGNIDDGLSDPDLTADEFIALLESSPGTTDTATQSNNDDDVFGGVLSEPEFDPQSEASATEKESIETAFPEFADAPRNTPVADNSGMPELFPPRPQGANGSVEEGSPQIQQTAFEFSEPAAITPAIKESVLPADVADHLKDIDSWIEAGETLEAHAALSRLYWKQPEVRSHVEPRLDKTAAEIYVNPTRHFAEPYMVQFGDTLESIAHEYEVPWQYLAQLNRVTPKTLQAGGQLKVLKGPFGAVVDLEEKRLTVHAHGWYVRSYQVGIGKDNSTPIGEFRVKEKLENPTWYNPNGGVVDGDDPTNPLGEYWLGLGNHIGIHGTIDPESIGASVSKGCIHVADGEITEVFQLLGKDSPVVIR